MREIRGKDVAAAIKVQIAEDVKKMNGYIPKLAIVRVGEEPDDLSYERGAVKNLTGQGLAVESCAFPADIDNDTFLRELKKINADDTVDGILLLAPLPSHLDEAAAAMAISPEKDIDCIGMINQAKLCMGDTTGFVPCTAQAVLEVLDYAGVDVTGKRVTIVGYGMTVGRPLTSLLLNRKATVSVCRSRTARADAEALCKASDVVVAAVGKAGFVDASCVKEGAAVVDVGINMGADGKLCGDVAYDQIRELAGIATPVPGGVGAVTTTILAKQLVRAAMLKRINK